MISTIRRMSALLFLIFVLSYREAHHICIDFILILLLSYWNIPPCILPDAQK